MPDCSVLIVSEEPTTGRIWALLVTDLQCRPIVVNSLELAINAIQASAPELLIIDDISKGDGGIQTCSALRVYTRSPILLLTPVNNESHTLEAYHAGVDECVVKPISPALFAAKAKVWLCRAKNVRTEGLGRLIVNGMHIIPDEHQLVAPDGTKIQFSVHQFRALHLLMSHPNRIFSNEEIVEQVWGFGAEGKGDSALVKNLMYRLRAKMRWNPDIERRILNVPGGYLFKR